MEEFLSINQYGPFDFNFGCFNSAAIQDMKITLHLLFYFNSTKFKKSICFHYGRRICEGLCSSKRRRCHNPQSPQRYFLSFSFSVTHMKSPIMLWRLGKLVFFYIIYILLCEEMKICLGLIFILYDVHASFSFSFTATWYLIFKFFFNLPFLTKHFPLFYMMYVLLFLFLSLQLGI